MLYVASQHMDTDEIPFNLRTYILIVLIKKLYRSGN